MRFKVTVYIVFLLALAALIPTGASAAISSVDDDIIEISAPSSVSEGDLESDDDIVAFLESENVTLDDKVITAISVPGTYSRLTHLTLGQIPGGTEVNSYLLHSDPDGKPFYPKTFEGSIVFDEEILGIVVTGLGLALTDDELGVSGTDYSNGILFRGVELYLNNDRVTLDEDLRTVTVKFKTSRRVDHIRVITAAGEADPDPDPMEELPTEGLVAHWPFESDLDQTAEEMINGLDGNLGDPLGDDTDDPAWVGGKIGTGLSFDGDNDYVVVQDDPNLHLPEYTWALWVNGAAVPGSSMVTQVLSNGDQRFVMSWDHVASSFVASAAHNTESGFISAPIQAPLMANTWYHVAATYDGTTLAVYLDGVKQAYGPVPPPVDVAGPLHMGAGVGAGGAPAVFFEGMLDEVRIYDRALTTDEVDILARQGLGPEAVDLTSGLQGHWAFDDNPQGQDAEDSSVNNHDGSLGATTAVGADDPTWDTGIAGGGNALRFDGDDDFVLVDAAPGEYAFPEYSWSLWINGDQAPGNTEITQPLSNADQQFVMSWDHLNGSFEGSAAHGIDEDSFVSVQLASDLMAGTWYHIAATFDADGNLRMYLNGNLEDSLFVAFPPVVAEDPAPLHFGAGVGLTGNPASFFPGAIDDVRIYDRALNKTEIKDLATP